MGEIWAIPLIATLEPYARVIKWGELGEEMEDNKKIITNNVIWGTWVNYPWTLIITRLKNASYGIKTTSCNRRLIALQFSVGDIIGNLLPKIE